MVYYSEGCPSVQNIQRVVLYQRLFNGFQKQKSFVLKLVFIHGKLQV